MCAKIFAVRLLATGLSAIAALSTLAATLPTDERASFIGLGDLPGGPQASFAMGISPDGKIIVGHALSEAGNEAFRWTDGVMTSLGGFPGQTVFSGAQDISADGQCIVGSATLDSNSTAILTIHGVITRLPGLPGDVNFAEAWGVSADGSVIVGQLQRADHKHAFVWKDGHVSVFDNVPDGRSVITASAISANGRVIVGDIGSANGIEAFHCVDGSLSGLGDLRGRHTGSTARGVSANGEVIVGAANSLWGYEPFRWEKGQMIGLGGLSDDQELFGMARDASADGTIIVGSSEDDAHGNEAFIWDAANGMRNLHQVLVNEYGLDLAGWSLNNATAISDDGRSITGLGRNPAGQIESWLARLGPSAAATATPATITSQTIFGAFHAQCADLAGPAAAVFRGDGSLLIADSANHCIRVIDADGQIRATWHDGFGSPLCNPQGVAIAPDGKVLVADTANDRVVVLDRDGKPLAEWGAFGSGPGQLNHPNSLAINGERVYIADTENDRVAVFDVNGQSQTNWGSTGDGPVQFRHPLGIAVDSAGNVYVADTGNNRVQKLDARGQLMQTIGRRGREPGFFVNPSGVACVNDHLYVADTGNHRIQVFDLSGNLQYVWGRRAMRPHESDGRLHFPAAIAVDAREQTAVVCEPREDRCQIFSTRDIALEPSGRPPYVPPAPPRAYFGQRMDIDGHIMAVVQPDRDGVDLFDLSVRDPVLVASIGDTGMRLGLFIRPNGVKLDMATARLFVSDAGNRQVQVFALDQQIGKGPPVPFLPTAPPRVRAVRSISCKGWRVPMHREQPNSATLADVTPADIELGSNGNLLLLDESNRMIWMLDEHFNLIRMIGRSADGKPLLRDPVDLAMNRTGSVLYVVDSTACKVRAFDLNPDAIGIPIASFGKPGRGQGEFFNPRGITASSDGFIYVTDDADRIQKFDEQGQFISQWGIPMDRDGIGAGELFKPAGIDVDEQNRIVVVDWGNHRAQIFSNEGLFQAVFGAGLYIRPARIQSEQE